MKVLHIEAGRYLYGGALQVKYLLEGLAARGVKNLLTCPPGSAVSQAAQTAATTVCEIRMAGELDAGLVFRLSSVLRRFRPDLVHIHSRRGADLWGLIAARSAGIPVVLTRRVDNPEPAWFARLKYRQCEKVVAISKGIQRVLEKEGVPAEKIECVYSAVDHRRYAQKCEHHWFRQEFGLASGEKVVGVVAQLIPRKGHKILIDGLPRVIRQFPETRVLFFGQGPLREELSAYCEKRQVAEAVCFAGFRNDLDRILPCLDLLVHPALMEGLGVSLLQASAAGVPVVASRTGGIPEVVRDGLTGVLVPPKDTDALVEGILSILKNPSKGVRLASAGRSLVREVFSIEGMVDRYLSIYDEMLGQLK